MVTWVRFPYPALTSKHATGGDNMKLPRRKIIAFDFDDTIHDYAGKWIDHVTIPGGPLPGAIEALLRYIQKCCVCIISSRFSSWQQSDHNTMPGRIAVCGWLIRHGIAPELINAIA